MSVSLILFIVFVFIFFKYPELGKAIWWAFLLTILALTFNSCSCIGLF